MTQHYVRKLPGSLILVAVLPFVALSIARIFTVLFSTCTTEEKMTLLSIQQSEHTVGLNLFQHLIS